MVRRRIRMPDAPLTAKERFAQIVARVDHQIEAEAQRPPTSSDTDIDRLDAAIQVIAKAINQLGRLPRPKRLNTWYPVERAEEWLARTGRMLQKRREREVEIRVRRDRMARH